MWTEAQARAVGEIVLKFTQTVTGESLHISAFDKVNGEVVILLSCLPMQMGYRITPDGTYKRI